MRAADRDRLRTVYAFRCGYCGVREADTGVTLTVDHFQPVSKGGPDTPDDWVYVCHTCSEFKAD